MQLTIIQVYQTVTHAQLGLENLMFLFGPAKPAEESQLEKELGLTDPDALSPKEAHEFLYHLKELLDDKA